MAQHAARGKIHDRNAGHLADIWHGSRRAGVCLDNVNLFADRDELHVDKTYDMQFHCQPSRVFGDRLLHLR